MPLISELLQDIYKTLDVASGFRVAEMTERTRAISAFITPS